MKKFFVALSFAALTLWGDIVIVTGKNPSDFEKRAADELMEFLPQISGEICRVVAEENVPSSGKMIFLGDTAAARNAGICISKCGREQWFIRGDGKKLMISGGRPVGTLYGVYAFLNKLGVRFFSWDTVKVPAKRAFSIPVIDENGKPDFAGRHIFDMYPVFLNKINSPEILKLWKLHRLRNNFNGSHSHQAVHRDLYEGDLLRLSSLMNIYHNFYSYLPPEKYFAKHPEFFSMNQHGKRFHGNPQGGNFCMTNPEAIKIIINSLREFIRRDRLKNPVNPPMIYDISQMDQTSFMCLCPPCKKIADAEGDCGLLLTFINQVAKTVAAEYPGVWIRTFAYSSTTEPPKTIRPEPNVLIQYCDPYMRSDCFRPLGHKFNKVHADMLQKWQKVNTNLMIWDYWNMGMNSFFNPPRPEVVLDAVPDDFRRFLSSGIKAVFIEAEKSFDSPQNFIDLEYYLAGRLMVDCRADVETIIDEFLDGYYGKGAVEMKKFLTILRKGVAAEPRRQVMMQVGDWSFLTPAKLVEIHKLLLAAEKKTVPGSPEYYHVRGERITPLWYSLYLRDKTMAGFNASGFREDELFKELETLVLEQIARYKGKNNAKVLAGFKSRFVALAANLQVPEKFAGIPGVKVFGWPQRDGDATSVIVDDKEAECGKVIVAKNFADAKYHGENTVRSLPVTSCGIWAPGVSSKSIRLRNLPKDGKLHWYTLPDVKIGGKTIFWAHLWRIKVNLNSAFRPEDNNPDINRYDVHFSIRFRGPAYIPGDKRPNEIAVEKVVLVPRRKK